ncbi:MAG: desulfoferrodoxin [Bacillota bacterium]|nr:desulfoferrodoxin [Bacillota bacterium]
MTEMKQVYICRKCGNMVEVLRSGGGTLTCCGESMVLLTENTQEAAVEKHIPVVEKNGDIVTVKVGSVEHPMTEEHHIEWIEVYTKDKLYRKYLNPGEKPEAEFKVDGEVVLVREHCNLHGLWKA